MISVPIAFSASFDVSKSAHAPTFRRAADLTSEWLATTRAIQLAPIWIDDGACSEGGTRAANLIVQSPALAVVGHFASSAAIAAAPIYSTHGLPLFLPAATAAGLRKYSGVHRLCDSDEDFATWIWAGLERRHWLNVCALSDGSTHGDSMCAAFARHTGIATRASQIPDEAQAVLFSGMLTNSIAFVEERLKAGETRPLLLTDDAQSNSLVRASTRRALNLRVLGFKITADTELARGLAALYIERWSEPPAVYFFETIAAIQAAVIRVTRDHTSEINTVLGPTRFDQRGESRPGRYAVYRIRHSSLVECEESWA